MKTNTVRKMRSVYRLMLTSCVVVLGPVASLRAEDSRFRFKIPNPIPRIAKKIGKVGALVNRTIERLDGPDEREEPRRSNPAPRLPEATTTKRVPASAGAGLKAAEPAQPSAAAITRPAQPSAAVITPAAGEETAMVASPEKIELEPKQGYGRTVPGHPGLVYPPGTQNAPENMIDVRGLAPGTKVRDPRTGTIFLVP
jgi:hypothetical protein